MLWMVINVISTPVSGITQRVVTGDSIVQVTLAGWIGLTPQPSVHLNTAEWANKYILLNSLFQAWRLLPPESEFYISFLYPAVLWWFLQNKSTIWTYFSCVFCDQNNESNTILRGISQKFLNALYLCNHRILSHNTQRMYTFTNSLKYSNYQYCQPYTVGPQGRTSSRKSQV